jgi:hypothetical protein
MLDGAQQTKRETQQNNRTLVTRWRTYRLLPPALRKDVDCWVCSEWGSVVLSCPSRVILHLVLRVTRLSRKLLCDRSFAWQDLRLHVVASLHPRGRLSCLTAKTAEQGESQSLGDFWSLGQGKVYIAWLS